MKVGFDLIASAALSRADGLLRQWLPGGTSAGHEYKALNPTRADNRKGSFSVNICTGAWADFAAGDKGGDLISLYAYLNGLSQIDAAKALAEFLGIDLDDKPSQSASSFTANQKQPQDKKRSPWRPILPVPGDAPKPPVAHYTRGKPDVVYTYRAADGSVNGYVYRYTTSTGGKETLPVCFCEHSETGARDWRWMAFPEPRPLYNLDLLSQFPDQPVLLVEGEKCADVANDNQKNMIAVTWPGGSKAVNKAEWSALAGRKVIAWADCDAKRRNLAKEEKEQGIDPATLPLLPEIHQPGMRAMLRIHFLLVGLVPKVDFQLVDIPKPGKKKDGWDIADAIEDGEDIAAWIQRVRGSKSKKRQSSESSSLLVRNNQIVSCLANVYDVLQNDPEWDGVLGYNEFTYFINKLKPPPFDGGCVGEWDEYDSVQTSMWITRKYEFAPSTQLIDEALEALAKSNCYHPVREYLQSLEWDGVSRINDWISDYIGASKNAYVMRVSRWFLMGMVARVMKPGIKFDYSLVLEGDQGRKKSSALRVLGGEWFGDTDLDLHSKDSMASIRGKWLYEFAELGSLARSEATKQKSFLSRQVDEFRPPYGRRDISSPRQLVFGGSTNEWEWNKDETGGRRFWPVECRHEIDCDGLAAVRDQLFAEAYQLYQQGKRFWPTAEEQRRIFDPVQVQRTYSDSYVDLLYEWVQSQMSEFNMADALNELKIEPARHTRDIQTRVGKALKALGCVKVEKRNHEIRKWYKPPSRSEAESVSENMDGGDVGIPF
jgi:putative DNA primase/helicase